MAKIESENLEIFQFKSLQSNQTYPYTYMMSLLPNRKFNLMVIAFNRYGSIGFTTSISTNAVIAVKVNTSFPIEIKCIFNAASNAIGCYLNLTHLVTGITSCIALPRFPNAFLLASFSLCQSLYTLMTGKYLLEAYDIEKDGSVSNVPALTDTFDCTSVESFASGT